MKKLLTILIFSLSMASAHAQVDSSLVTTSLTMSRGDWEYAYKYFGIQAFDPLQDTVNAVLKRANPYPLVNANVTISNIELGEIYLMWDLLRQENQGSGAVFNHCDAAVKALNIPWLTNQITAVETIEGNIISATRTASRRRILGQRG